MKRLIGNMLRWLLAGVFLWAGLAKAAAPYEFLAALVSIPFFPFAYAAPTAIILPYLEIVTGFALLVPAARRAGALIAAALSLAFLTMYLLSAWHGMTIDCGCFGPGSQVSTAQGIGRSLILLALSISVYSRRNTERRLTASYALES